MFKATTMQFGIFPACLPLKPRREEFGFHSGWSSPIPFHILTENAPGFTKIYRDFFKQIHFKMEIFETCQDANEVSFLGIFGIPAEFLTNTFYPAGTLLKRIFLSQGRTWSSEPPCL